MSFDLKASHQKIRPKLNAVLDTTAPPSVHRSAYQAALVAIEGLPKRTGSIAYVLGVVAGTDFYVHNKLPSQVFKPGTEEAEDYSTGVKDALQIGQEYLRLTSSISVGQLFNEIFGNPSGSK